MPLPSSEATKQALETAATGGKYDEGVVEVLKEHARATFGAVVDITTEDRQYTCPNCKEVVEIVVPLARMIVNPAAKEG